MIETLLGGLLGGAFRLAPEVLKWFDRQGERGHELAMQDKALDLRKRYDWCDHQTYFVAVHAGAFLPVFALYPETLPNRETAVDYAQRLKRNLLVGINVPFAAASDDELFITVNLNAQATDANIQVDEHCALVWSDAASSGAVRTMAFPFIHVQAPASVAAGGSALIELRIEDVAGQLLDREAVVYKPDETTPRQMRSALDDATGTKNRSALIIGTPAGGVLILTLRSKDDDNLLKAVFVELSKSAKKQLTGKRQTKRRYRPA